MKDLKSYKGWALITGASSGIGREFARTVASHGVNCVLVARRKDRLQSLSEELSDKHRIECRFIDQDLTADGYLERINKETEDIPIGILINNAGAGCPGPTATRDFERIESLVKLNCLAPAMITRSFLPQMIERNRGAVIFLSSIVGLLPTPYETIYSASKAFNLNYGEALWGEMRGTNIDVITVCPAATKTEFFSAEGLDEKIQKRINGFADNVDRIPKIAFRYLGSLPTVGPRSMWLPATVARFLPRAFVPLFAGKFAKRVMQSDRL